MTAPNHIVGGIVITGISLSFWDINIFSKSSYLSICIFSSMLPDIDHTKSLIGKMFFPLAKYLDVRFGHRTITHSITLLIPLFIFSCFFELNIINPYFQRSGLDFSLIFFFSFLSHLILDMLTIDGIPLFYPFLKNPCVIPSNPNLRFRSGNIKSEAIALFIFTFILFSSYNLFKNGFWTTYNRSFGTIKHGFREFKESEKLVFVNYKFSFNGSIKKGTGYILDATQNKLELFCKTSESSPGRILIIDNKDHRTKNISVLPKQSKYTYSVQDFKFFNLSLKEINDTLNTKIVSGIIMSSDNFSVNKYKALLGSIELEKEISPKFQWLKSDTLKKQISDQIDLKKIKLNEIKKRNKLEEEKLKLLKNSLLSYNDSLDKVSSIYKINKYEQLIINQKKKIKNFRLKLKTTKIIIQEINVLQRDLNHKGQHFFTGDLKLFYVPTTYFKVIK